MNDCLRKIVDYCGVDDVHSPIQNLLTTVPNFSELGPHVSEEKHFSQFVAKRDTWLYGTLISQALKAAHDVSPEAKLELHDLGIGSAIPTILGLKKACLPLSTLSVHGIDIDASAVAIAQSNLADFLTPAERENLKFEVKNQSFADYLSRTADLEARSDAFRIFASNPPYVPVDPSERDSTGLEAIDGGLDGLKHIDLILEKALLSADLLALQWSSLTSPPKLISKLEANFDLIASACTKVPFGRLTSRPAVRAYLEKLKSRGEAFFEDETSDSGLSYIVIGTVLRPKCFR